MAGGITVTPEQLQSISSQLLSGESEIESILSQLASAVSPLSSTWVGAAQAQFEELWAQWQRDASGLRQALTGIAKLTAQAASSYEQTEQSIASSFNQGWPKAKLIQEDFMDGCATAQIHVSVPRGLPGDQSARLADVARRFHAGEASVWELSLAFCEAVLFCRRGERDGQFMAVGAPGAGVIPMYSSEVALARAEGPCEWFSGHGASFVGLVPEGYGVVVDRGSDGEVVLHAGAIRRGNSMNSDVGPPGGAYEG